MVSVQSQVEHYLENHPQVRSCLKQGLVNYSALARAIATKYKLKPDQFDALLIAARRAYEKLKKSKDQSQKIQTLLQKSKVELKNKIAVFVFAKKIPNALLTDLGKLIKEQQETFHLTQSPNAVTLITSEEFQDTIKKMCKYYLIHSQSQLVEITLKSPKEIENTPGAMTFLFSLLSEKGINIVEMMSCWTDTIFILHEKDVGSAMQLFRF